LQRLTKIDPYFHVSNIYSHLMNFISYKWWARYIYKITKTKTIKNPTVLEVAAGNCSMAKWLQKLYPNYIATDISLSMLKKSKSRISLVCCDMTRLPFNKKFDLIISSFDSINYITSKRVLLLLFNEIFKSLNKDGIFTFDAALENNSYKHEKTASGKWKKSGFVYSRESKYLIRSKVHKNIFRIQYPDGKVFTETHRQKIYSFQTFYAMAEKSGFNIVNCYKAFSLQKGNANSDRVQFIMKRKD
jgi:ubiquinone/menaquinone biosynthesis C-methylase UbiE